jgi:hypothetical protein
MTYLFHQGTKLSVSTKDSTFACSCSLAPATAPIYQAPRKKPPKRTLVPQSKLYGEDRDSPNPWRRTRSPQVLLATIIYGNALKKVI